MIDGLTAGTEKMRRDGVAEEAIAAFEHYHRQLAAGETGLLPEAEIEPALDVQDADALAAPAPGEAATLLDQAVVVKLNGGLGTSMGLSGPKSLLEVKDGMTFLDVVAQQVLALRERSGARVPLVLMNSFSTRRASLEALRRHERIEVDVPLDFVQNKIPKLRPDDLTPVEWPADPALEWCPPGHGDLYTALQSSGMLSALLERGYRYAFVSNSDNLGATVDERILSWFATSGAPFAMEVADRTEADRKGGHLARRAADGGLVLRELAQAPDEDIDAFQDVTRHRYFNTNNLWLDLRALADVLAQRGSVLGLPMIVNRKTVDPADRGSPPVLQLETAMGAAIGVFEASLALRVPRTRLVPVKTTDDLLAVRSDAYRLDAAARVVPAEGRSAEDPPVVRLDPEFFKLLPEFEARFPSGPPSLRECARLEVTGDVSFGAGVVCRGSVVVRGPRRVEDGAVLAG